MKNLCLFDKFNPGPDPEVAALRRDVGMARATRSADTRHDGWANQAYAFLVRYAADHATFAGWEVVRAANLSGEVPVVSGKAWGAVFVRAANQGVIAKADYRPDPNRNQNPAPVWASLVHRSDAAGA